MFQGLELPLVCTVTMTPTGNTAANLAQVLSTASFKASLYKDWKAQSTVMWIFARNSRDLIWLVRVWVHGPNTN